MQCNLLQTGQPISISDNVTVGTTMILCRQSIVCKYTQTWIETVDRNRGFRIGCLNISGLLNKIDEMKVILQACKFDVMGVCETFIDDNIADHEITIEGYNVVKKNRTRHGGGVLLYIKDSVRYTVITKLAGS